MSSLKQLAISVALPISIGGISLYLATHHYGYHNPHPGNPIGEVEKKYCKMLEEAIADEASAEAFYERMIKLAEQLPADKRIWIRPMEIARVADDEARHGRLWKQQKEYLCEE